MTAIDYVEKKKRYHRFAKNKQVSAIRNKKVQDMKRRIKSGEYNLDGKLSIAMDRLIEEILKNKPENKKYSLVS